MTISNALRNTITGLGLLLALVSPSFGAENAAAESLSLEDFFSAALEYSPKLRIAADRVDIGSARRQAANGRLLPQLAANANVSENRRDILNRIEEYPGQRYSLQLTQVLFNWQTFAARSQAYLVEDQLEAEYYNELSVLLTDVAEKYFNVLQAEDALTSIRSELEAVTNQLSLVQSYYDRQLTQITDLYEAQATLAAVQAEQLARQSELELARDALRSVSGLAAGGLYRLSDEVQVPAVENSVNYWVEQAQASSHLIRAREYAMQAAEKRIDESRGAYMPRVSFVVTRQNSELGYDNALIPRTDTTYVGVDVSIPLYTGGSIKAGVSEAMSQHNIAENELRQVELEVGERTRAAYLRAQYNQSRTQAAQRLAESTALAAQAMQQGFELGTVNSVDVLNALRDQFRAERDLQQARYEHVKSLLVLKREAGTLVADDLLDVSSWLVAPQE
ncbi:MAG: hypothetical protein RLZZ385_702 [Pseudomonadota bacterium]|jgi:outer membrane protein